METFTVPSMEDVFRGIQTVHLRAADARTTPSVQLEMEQPSDAVEHDTGADAFGRILEHCGIVTRDNPAAGVYSTRIGRLLSGEHVMPDGQKIGRAAGRAIGMVWAERAWRRAKYGLSPNTRGLFISEDDALGTAVRPWTDNPTVRDVMDRTPNIPLSAIVATETSIEDDAYRSIYVDETAIGTFDFKRVTEGAEIPTVDLRTSEQEIRLHKRGRAINWTYEAARNMRLDKFQLIIDKMAMDVEAGKIAQAVGVLMAGDGNNNAPTVIDLTAMDSTLTAGDPPSLRSILRYKKTFRGAFRLTTILGNIEDITDLEMIEIGLDSTPWVALGENVGIGRLSAINDQRTNNDIGYADLDAGIVPAGILLGFDARWALERVSQIGATISEADNFINNQTNLLTFTDTDGFALMFEGAVHPLDTDA